MRRWKDHRLQSEEPRISSGQDMALSSLSFLICQWDEMADVRVLMRPRMRWPAVRQNAASVGPALPRSQGPTSLSLSAPVPPFSSTCHLLPCCQSQLILLHAILPLTPSQGTSPLDSSPTHSPLPTPAAAVLSLNHSPAHDLPCSESPRGVPLPPG